MNKKYEISIIQLEDMSFNEFLSLDERDDLKVIFNKNNSGLKDYYNFMDVEEMFFENVEEIKNKAEELNLPRWTVISFYAENGYDGVYTRTGEEALTTKCNNWVNQGRDGFLFVAFAKNEETLEHFVESLNNYITTGFYEVIITENEEIIDSEVIMTKKCLENAKKRFKKLYDLSI